ncbi:MAG: hypothetical protein N2D54_02605, partial [Chloroflexota bacterium]
MNTKFRIIILVFLLGLSACGANPGQSNAGNNSVNNTAVEDSGNTNEAPTEEPTEPPTPAPTATPALYIARGRVDSPLLNLRSGPSTMHGILQSFFEGEELYAKARVPEGD